MCILNHIIFDLHLCQCYKRLIYRYILKRQIFSFLFTRNSQGKVNAAGSHSSLRKLRLVEATRFRLIRKLLSVAADTFREYAC